MEGDLMWGGEPTIQYVHDVLQNYMPENCVILLTNVTPVSSIKIKINNTCYRATFFLMILFFASIFYYINLGT